VTIINDGIGRGNSAKVDSDNRLAVDAGVRPISAIKALTGDCYVASMDATVSVSATGGIVSFIENTSSTKSIVIDKVVVSCSAAQLTYKSSVGVVKGTLAVAEEAQLTNTNTSSAKTPGVGAYVWTGDSGDGMTGLTGGKIVNLVELAAGAWDLDDDDTLVIAPGGTFSVHLDNDSGGTNNCAVHVRFYEITL